MNQNLEENEYAMKFFDINLGTNMLEKLKIQRDAGELCDVTLKIKDNNYQAHGNVLAACSPYFSSLFIEKRCIENTHSICCGDVPSVEAMINYMYSGVVVVCYENVDGLLSLAHHYLIIELANYCNEFLKATLSLSTCVLIRWLAEKYGLYELGATALKYLSRNIREILQSQDILNYRDNQLRSLIACPGILTTENKIETLLRWLSYKPTERLDSFKAMLTSMDLSAVSVAMVIPFIRNCESFFQQLHHLKEFFVILRDAGLNHEYIGQSIELAYEKQLSAVNTSLQRFDRETFTHYMTNPSTLTEDQKLFSAIIWVLSLPPERLKYFESLLTLISFDEVDKDLFVPYLKRYEDEITRLSLYDWQHFFCSLRESGFTHPYIIDNIRVALIKITELQGYEITKFKYPHILTHIALNQNLSYDRRVQVIIKWILVDISTHIKDFDSLLQFIDMKEVSEKSLVSQLTAIECMFVRDSDLFLLCRSLWAAGFFHSYVSDKLKLIAGEHFNLEEIHLNINSEAFRVPVDENINDDPNEIEIEMSKPEIGSANIQKFEPEEFEDTLEDEEINNEVPEMDEEEISEEIDVKPNLNVTNQSIEKVIEDQCKEVEEQPKVVGNQSIVLRIKTPIMKGKKPLKKGAKSRRKTKIPQQIKERFHKGKQGSKNLSEDDPRALDDPEYDFKADVLERQEQLVSQVKKGKTKQKPKNPRKLKQRYQCNICLSYSTKDPSKLKLHIGKSHKDNFTFVCNLCPFEAKWNKEFYNHMKEHIPGPPFKCDFPPCEYKSDRIQPLLYHRMKHTDERPHSCEHCTMRFRTKSNLVTHLRCHTGERPFACEKCDKSFTQKGTLEQHLASHSTNRPFLCDVCGFATKYNSHLKAHKRIHTGNVHRCEFPNCKYLTPRLSLLKAHNRSHTGSREFVCGHCGKAFIEKSHLVRHEKLHTNDMSFKCKDCDYKTYRSDKLKEHIAKHHSEDSQTRQNKPKIIRQSERQDQMLQTTFQQYSGTNITLPCISVGGPYSKTLDVQNLTGAHILAGGLYDDSQPAEVHGQPITLAKIGMIQEDPRLVAGPSTGIQYVIDQKLSDSIQHQDLFTAQATEPLGIGSFVALL